MTKARLSALSGLSYALLSLSCAQPVPIDFPTLSGPYLGQEPPGVTPTVFAPGVLNTEQDGAFCTVFSPDGDEFYFTYYRRGVEGSGGLACMRRLDDTWAQPEVLPFSSDDIDNDVFMSSDGRRIVFRSWRALPDGRKPEGHSFLWIVERTEGGWGEAQPLLCGGKPVRTGYPSLTANDSLYFAHRSDDISGIFRSKLVNGAYETPEHVFTAVDSIDTEGDMYVAPDESYMIISLWDHPENIGSGKGDLYVTFKNADGSWTDEINMGDLVNTHCGENCPIVSPDGKYFFFNRYCEDTDRGDMYWVDAEIIESYRSADNLSDS